MKERQTAKPSLLKRINLNTVLNTIRLKGPISRASLSRTIGISKPTMSNIIKSLEKDGLIIKAGIGESTAEGGKKPVLYKFNKDYGYIIGAEIRINEILVVLSNYEAIILSSVVTEIGENRSKKEVIKKLFDSFELVIKKAKVKKNNLKGIGVGLHGIVDHKKGTLISAPHFPEWGKNINFSKKIKDKYKVKTYIDNQDRMLVCAEKIFGLGRKYNNIVAIGSEEGIGAGIIIKGDIYRGNDFIAGEIGHTIINPDGPKCSCGKAGCAEVMISTKILKENIKTHIKNNKDSILYKKFKDDINSIKLKDIFEAYVSDDRFTEDIMSDIEHYFEIFIANIILHYNPEIIIIEGDYVEASNKFIKRIEDNINDQIFPNLKIKPNIKLSELGRFAGPLGSVSLILSKEINFSNVWEN